ncbi:MAG TPA: cupin domain-containing protein [Alphaproteobacteria bacterium]|jgi:quercetin dioxygenase-like cupin family protein|nr:cupin domain-containing protein [Alphaproteobacteria bacterium]HBA41981.1 cupin domain-containing protein [Alphaproteobacteria bacterium]
MKITKGFPGLIKDNFPDVRIPLPGISGNLLQGENCQLVFMEFDEDFNAPPHRHKAHWGMVLEGEAEMTISGETQVYGPGEFYIVPEDAEHSARIKKGTRSIDIWFDKDYMTVAPD